MPPIALNLLVIKRWINMNTGQVFKRNRDCFSRYAIANIFSGNVSGRNLKIGIKIKLDVNGEIQRSVRWYSDGVNIEGKALRRIYKMKYVRPYRGLPAIYLLR